MSTLKKNFRPTLLAAATALSALAAAGALFIGLHSGPANAVSAPAEAPALPVSVAAVATTQASAWNEFSGRLEAVDRVELRSRAAGTVQAVHFREGALVAKGDLLFTIDPLPYAADVERVEAQVAAARARLTHASSELQRAQRLWEERAIAQREYDERANAQREAEANLRAAQAALQTAQLNLGYTQVRAPIAGRISKVEVKINAESWQEATLNAPPLSEQTAIVQVLSDMDAEQTALGQRRDKTRLLKQGMMQELLTGRTRLV